VSILHFKIQRKIIIFSIAKKINDFYYINPAGQFIPPQAKAEEGA